MTTMAASGFQRDDQRALVFFGVTLAVSVAAHAVTIIALPNTLSQQHQNQRVEMEFYEPPPPPPPPEPEPPKPPEPEPPKVKVKPPPVKVAKAEAPPPKEDAPPPPNDAPPPEKPSAPVPIVVGISMSSTTSAGSFAVGVGNTTYGKASAPVDPNSVKAYSAPKYVPPGGADTEPTVAGTPYKPPYPDEAKKNEIEGPVRLRVTIDPEGRVTDAVVISGPGYGLEEAARVAMLKHYRFKPAMKGGEPVGTTIVYTMTFLLD